MKHYRNRLLAAFLAITMLMSLVSAMTATAAADSETYGKTTAPSVKLRKSASTSADYWFALPQDYICTIRETKTVKGVAWYRVVAHKPGVANSNTYYGYVHGDYFRPLTDEEEAAYLAGLTPTPTGAPVVTPTQVPGPETTVPVVPTATPGGNTEAGNGATGSVTNGGTNFREGPGTSYHSLFKLERGTVVELLTIPATVDEDHWYKVYYNGQTGYIMSTFIRVISAGTTQPVAPTATPTPTTTAEQYTHVKLILTSCHLRLTPGGEFDPENDWEEQGGVLPINGAVVVTKGSKYKWYPVLKDGLTYYVRSDCVQPVYIGPTGAPTEVPTATPTQDPSETTPVPTLTPTPAPAYTYGYVKTTKAGCNLRLSPGSSTVLTQVPRNKVLAYISQPVVKSGKTWYNVTYEGKTGWLVSDVVIETDEKGNKATPTPKPTGTVMPTATPTVTGSALSKYVITTVDKVYLRASASKDSEAKFQVELGTVMAYTTKSTVSGSTWYYVVYKDNRVWVLGSCVKIMTQAEYEEYAKAHPSNTPQTDVVYGYVKTNTSKVNLRKTVAGDVIGSIVESGTLMPFVASPTVKGSVTWYYVKHPTLGYGYVHGNYVNIVNSDGSPTPTPTRPSGAEESQQEASYTTLKLGSSGNAVKNLVKELINQGFYHGDVTSKYTSAVEKAVTEFQTAKGLTPDGIAGSATQHKLYGTVPIGEGDTNNLTMTIYPAEKIDWNTGGIQQLWPKGANVKVYDVKTGIVWWCHRWSGFAHVDGEPLTAADTARLCRIYGVSSAAEIATKDLYQRRPCLITIGTRTFACSLYGEPHNYPDGDTISNNNYKGQLCIHFTNSTTSDTKKIDSGHKEAIKYAWLNAPNGHI